MNRQDLAHEINRLHANICAALSDPTRILILYVLADGPSSVNAIVEELDLPQPSVSRHLKLLRERDLVRSRRKGKYVMYSLADPRVIEALDLLREVLAEKLSHSSLLAEKVGSSFHPN